MQMDQCNVHLLEETSKQSEATVVISFNNRYYYIFDCGPGKVREIPTYNEVNKETIKKKTPDKVAAKSIMLFLKKFSFHVLKEG